MEKVCEAAKQLRRKLVSLERQKSGQEGRKEGKRRRRRISNMERGKKVGTKRKQRFRI